MNGELPTAASQRLRLILDGRPVAIPAAAAVSDGVIWVDGPAVALHWGAQLDVGEDVLGWRDVRTGQTVVFRRARAEAEVGGVSRRLSAPPDWSDGRLNLPVDAVALAGGARWHFDEAGGCLYVTRPDPYLSRRRILLDPGHGGRDTGARYGDEMYEKDLNLDVARRLAVVLRASGAVVTFTRRGDRELDNLARCNMARANRADIVLSIHHNAHTDPSLQGAEAYYYRREDSRRLAAALLAALTRELGVQGRGVREANVGVLRCLTMPAALTEAAFVTEPQLARAFHQPWTRVREALALLDGLRQFCGELAEAR